jgi:hypothetical protein
MNTTHLPGRLAGALILAGVLAGCAPPAPAPAPGTGGGPVLDLTVQPQPARAGQEVVLTLTNRSDREVGYNLCPTLLQRRVGGDWQTSPVPFTEVCTMELRVLAPGDSATFRHPLPTGIPAGTYRFWAGVEWPLGGARAGVQSAPFEVAG